jgi:hypothetical protein
MIPCIITAAITGSLPRKKDAGSLNANQFCIRCTRSIDSSGYGLRPRPATG